MKSNFISLDDLISASQLTPSSGLPYLLQMPSMPSEGDFPAGEFHSGDVTNLFQTIPTHSWVLPYILVGAVTLSKQSENKTTLCADSDVSLKPRAIDGTTSPSNPVTPRDHDNVKSSSSITPTPSTSTTPNKFQTNEHQISPSESPAAGLSENDHSGNNSGNDGDDDGGDGDLDEVHHDQDHHSPPHHSDSPTTQKKKKHFGLKKLFHLKKKKH